VWTAVADRLRAHGHDVHTVTLPGLGHRVQADPVTLDTHVTDVLTLLRGRDLTDVVLVGHGTSGVIAGLVADRSLHRVEHVVYIEGFLPQEGRSTIDAFQDPVRDHELRCIVENQGRWPAPDAETLNDGQGLSTEQAGWLAEKLVDHPGRPLTDVVHLLRPLLRQRATYIVCLMDHFDERLADDVEGMRAASNWTFRYLDTGLWPMISAPGELVALLLEPHCQDSLHPS
jgi:pimeloyl-ACP methyl ester carboxylesterase